MTALPNNHIPNFPQRSHGLALTDAGQFRHWTRSSLLRAQS
jgi:hypothetical protein